MCTLSAMPKTPKHFDEMNGLGEHIRAPYVDYCKWFEGENNARLLQKSEEAEALFRLIGVTFNVYGDPDATPTPADVVTYLEWCRRERHR